MRLTKAGWYKERHNDTLRLDNTTGGRLVQMAKENRNRNLELKKLKKLEKKVQYIGRSLKVRETFTFASPVEVLGALQAYCSSYIGCLAGLGLVNQHHADLVRTESHQDLFWLKIVSCFRASLNGQFRCCCLSRSPRRCFMGQEDLFPALRNIGRSFSSLLEYSYIEVSLFIVPF